MRVLKSDNGEGLSKSIQKSRDVIFGRCLKLWLFLFQTSKKGGAAGGSSTAYYDDDDNVESDDDTIRKRSSAKKGSGKKTTGSGFPGKRKVDVGEHDEDHDLKRIKAEPDPIGHGNA